MSSSSPKKTSKLKDRVKKLFYNGFNSKNIQHPLFDVSRTEAKRLLITKKGLQDLRSGDKKLYVLVKKFVSQNKLSAPEFSKQIDRWVNNLKRKTGETKSSFRQPTKVLHSLSKAGSITRPLDVIHMDLADVNRLNPDNQRYRYPFILVAVDAFSNYTVLVPVKDKSADAVMNGIKNVFDQMGVSKKTSASSRLKETYKRKSKRAILDGEEKDRAKRWCLVTTKLQTDRGSEFVNDTLRIFLKRRRVELFSSHGSGKAYLAESKIGQMKRQLVRIQNILEKSFDKKKKRKRKTTTKKKKKKKKLGGDEDFDDEDRYVDFEVYQTDWSKHLKDLQKKINSMKNTRTGYSPEELFKRFTKVNHDKDDWEKRNTVNETSTKFEPLDDTLVKVRLLHKANQNSRREKRLLARTQEKTKIGNKAHAWKRKLRVGDRVFLTHSRLKGYPSEKPLNIFQKKSTQTKSEWNTNRPYTIEKIYNSKKSHQPLRYRLRNVDSGRLQKTLYYREELISPSKK